MDAALDVFSPRTRAWFERAFAAPTPAQQLAWPAIATGEHVLDWHFEDDPALVPYAGTARLLAEHDWPRLYDADALAAVDLPGAAAVYVDDPFVVQRFSEETLALLPGVRAWVTDDYLHNGLRVDGGRILDRLVTLARGTA